MSTLRYRVRLIRHGTTRDVSSLADALTRARAETRDGFHCTDIVTRLSDDAVVARCERDAHGVMRVVRS